MNLENLLAKALGNVAANKLREAFEDSVKEQRGPLRINLNQIVNVNYIDENEPCQEPFPKQPRPLTVISPPTPFASHQTPLPIPEEHLTPPELSVHEKTPTPPLPASPSPLPIEDRSLTPNLVPYSMSSSPIFLHGSHSPNCSSEVPRFTIVEQPQEPSIHPTQCISPPSEDTPEVITGEEKKKQGEYYEECVETEFKVNFNVRFTLKRDTNRKGRHK